MKRVYLDYAATAPLDPRVRRAMESYFSKIFGNPSSIHAEGSAAKKALDSARAQVAHALEAHADEIVFTGGGTEANNLAVFGVINSKIKNPHIITTNIEHSSILEPLRTLARGGEIEVTYVSVEPNGIVKLERIMSAIRQNTVLVSVQYANNEIGTIQPIAKIGKALHGLTHRPLFHCDACQAPLYLNCLVNALGVDLLSLDAHKIYGPKGVGCLYVRRGARLAPLLYGGGQEQGRRATTENVPGIVGFAEALALAVREREKESFRLATLCDFFHSYILKDVGISQKVIINGSMERKERLPNNLNLSFPGADTEMLLLQLDAAGIAVSTKSSCLKDERESYVVKALGGGTRRARATLRFSFGRWTTQKDLIYTAKALGKLLSTYPHFVRETPSV